jgi:hypothetical protein
LHSADSVCARQGDNIVFNGNGHTFDGQGAKVWDGKVRTRG